MDGENGMRRQRPNIVGVDAEDAAAVGQVKVRRISRPGGGCDQKLGRMWSFELKDGKRQGAILVPEELCGASPRLVDFQRLFEGIARGLTTQRSAIAGACCERKSGDVRTENRDAPLSISPTMVMDPEVGPVEQPMRLFRRVSPAANRTEFMIRKLAFQRMVRDIAQDLCPNVKFQSTAIMALQEAAEAYLTGIFAEANCCALTHRQKVTMDGNDIRLASRIRGWDVRGEHQENELRWDLARKMEVLQRDIPLLQMLHHTIIQAIGYDKFPTYL
eukprot:CAMPEP_0114515842 /NCGR_PEP_ID=MMETSP0109-20121206/16984_1 /TAXON_ID=29199 /ORGANISM="Chlorarachnion reptans, Strain CCCM449" /LENGTH=273 /DNA_ID=CAMNT_0001696139 /DNA_START=82 /DNA_END=903 /DNA_ORIENTATION=+